VLFTTVLVVCGVGAADHMRARTPGPAPVADGTSVPSASSAALGRASGTTAAPQPTTDWDQVLDDALDTVTGGADARYSVAILDTGSGACAVHGDGSYDTASIVKVDILATLLLRAQADDRALTTQEKASAKVMIENSDNDAATSLWKEIGEADGLASANKLLGLANTKGGTGVLWGLTQTTAADQIELLKEVFGDSSVLDSASRTYIQELMGQVETDQDWGVPSAATGSYAVKNGWLQRSTDWLWDINSIGRVTAEGHTYLVAVVSKGNATRAEGIDLIEDAAQAAVHAFTKASGDGRS